MKSPFPGMDPYIEACGLWEDFHQHLIGEISNALAEAAPERYLVRTGERPYVVLTETATESGPVSMRAFIEEEYREAFIEIYETDPEQHLVTCVEVLSPANKRRGSTGWDLYLRKRQGLLLYTANLVEIDLLRGGQRMPMVDPWPNSPYTLLVARKAKAPYCKVWPAHYRAPLPEIPVPLATPDPDLSLNLQPMIEAIYVRYRYHRSINYARPLAPPLGQEETAWLEQLLRARAGQA